jgi:hypothetical protein
MYTDPAVSRVVGSVGCALHATAGTTVDFLASIDYRLSNNTKLTVSRHNISRLVDTVESTTRYYILFWAML